MRVIAGTLKGRRLTPPTWDGLRPTSDRLRETLFNVLAPRMPGAAVFDGYTGTGAVGIEALSRGARSVTFVDRDRRATALVAANLAACGVQGGYTIRCDEVARVLGCWPVDEPFDLILLDPPYDIEDVAPVFDAAARVLRPSGVVVLERATRRAPEVGSALAHVRDVRSGDSTLSIYAPRGDDAR
jgi:16S rRNA (guanine(966)-N(2))-methyltransferase RsmD